jgi:hypothetical protein
MSHEQGPPWREYKLDEYGIVLEIWFNEVRKVGPRDEVREAMRRFLASVDASEDR